MGEIHEGEKVSENVCYLDQGDAYMMYTHVKMP